MGFVEDFLSSSKRKKKRREETDNSVQKGLLQSGHWELVACIYEGRTFIGKSSSIGTHTRSGGQSYKNMHFQN